MASRKDYVAAASSIKKIKNPKDRARMTVLFGNRFADDNPRFDWTRWKTACGYKKAKVSKGPVMNKSSWFNW